MKYWNKFYRESDGNYCAESDLTTDIIHIFRLSSGIYAWRFNKGMNLGTFRNLREAKKYFGI